jgi:hypothetical protein
MFCSEWQSEAVYRFALLLIVLMSLRPAIPRRVALLHCSLPLHRTISIVNGVAGTVNHHSAGAGEFSVGDLGLFQLALTTARLARARCTIFVHPTIANDPTKSRPLDAANAAVCANRLSSFASSLSAPVQ